MKQYLFRFGYEDVYEFDSNRNSKSDLESCYSVFIQAENEELAINWGVVIAQRFVEDLFGLSNRDPYSWLSANFSYWIEDDFEAGKPEYKVFQRLEEGEYININKL